MIVKVEHLSKSFGDIKVIKDISFELETGKIMRYLGRMVQEKQQP